MKKQARVEYRIRSSVSSALYERILREAAARRLSVSRCIRADLQELYAIRDELARPIQVAPAEPGKKSALLHRLLAETETRLAADLGRQIGELESLRSAVRRIEVMLDRQYAGLMLYLPDVPENREDARARGAHRRYEAWKEAVRNLLHRAGDPA